MSLLFTISAVEAYLSAVANITLTSVSLRTQRLFRSDSTAIRPLPVAGDDAVGLVIITAGALKGRQLGCSSALLGPGEADKAVGDSRSTLLADSSPSVPSQFVGPLFLY
jgi:hypothetical protein